MMTLRDVRSWHWLQCRRARFNANNERLAGSESAARNQDHIGDFHISCVVAINDVLPAGPDWTTAEQDGKDNPSLQQIEHDIEVTARLLRMKSSAKNN